MTELSQMHLGSNDTSYNDSLKFRTKYEWSTYEKKDF